MRDNILDYVWCQFSVERECRCIARLRHPPYKGAAPLLRRSSNGFDHPSSYASTASRFADKEIGKIDPARSVRRLIDVEIESVSDDSTIYLGDDNLELWISPKSVANYCVSSQMPLRVAEHSA